jgi:urocanate hydratase
MYSGHPMGLFLKGSTTSSSYKWNGHPNYSQPDDWKMNALCISIWTNDGRKLYVYRPTGIVHGTTITVLNGFQNKKNHLKAACNLWFRWNEWRTTQRGTIAGCITVCADVNQRLPNTSIRAGLTNYWGSWQISKQSRFSESQQRSCVNRIFRKCSWYMGKFDQEKIILIGSDQTSLHNPWRVLSRRYFIWRS